MNRHLSFRKLPVPPTLLVQRAVMSVSCQKSGKRANDRLARFPVSCHFARVFDVCFYSARTLRPTDCFDAYCSVEHRPRTRSLVVCGSFVDASHARQTPISTNGVWNPTHNRNETLNAASRRSCAKRTTETRNSPLRCCTLFCSATAFSAACVGGIGTFSIRGFRRFFCRIL